MAHLMYFLFTESLLKVFSDFKNNRFTVEKRETRQ